ncbi:N-acetylmuramoyl-L-alanine amidase [Amycolatopsis antarctica]|uniref:N-acetylmuramoyl-L-alanine amidase n=1 Tax=Amycolatopsis antarctica TaxID=1854586 RepID=A0A263D0H0_9PSEU|nr:peptidoglycan recognition family protein [Amycolatopsis antarctica]OZM71026.1 N-acetylmuramoyl-L-alanine amidase [Amycolatopsis antarctica]
MPSVDRRTLIKGGLTVTAVGALGALPVGSAFAESAPVESVSGKAAPTMYSRSDWNARKPSSTVTVLDRKPTYIVVHHTASPGNTDDFSKARAFEVSRIIQNAHMDGNGWSDSGQQFTNSRGGFIVEGRQHSLDALKSGNKHVEGAHVSGKNTEAIGIENEGNYVTASVPAKLWSSLVELVSYMASQYGVTPANIKGHRDFNSTECPGGVLYGRLPELRKAVGKALNSEVLTVAEWPLLKPGDTGQKVLAAQHLLRGQGLRGVPTDGVFGPATADAVAAFADARGVERHTCMASMLADERGFLGADVWPLLTPSVAPGTGSDAARAAGVLADSTGTRSASLGTLNTQAWKELLSA